MFIQENIYVVGLLVVCLDEFVGHHPDVNSRKL